MRQTPRPHTTTRPPHGDDAGSLLLAMLFTLMMSALVIVMVASVMAGLNKSKNGRDYAIALQTADIAFADAVMYANLGCLDTPVRTTCTDTTPTSHNGAVGNVTWTWTATKQTGTANNWSVAVETQGKSVDRKFQATITGTRVLRGISGDSDNDGKRDLRYTVDETEYFGNGFFGLDEFKANPDHSADIDGYNGGKGIVGSNALVNTGGATMDQINLWNHTTDTGRCTGASCATAQIKRYKESLTLNAKPLYDACAPGLVYPAFYASSGAHLVAGRCYEHLWFDANYTPPPLNQMVYATGVVVADPGVTVNMTRSNLNAPSKNLRIGVTGTGGYGATVWIKEGAAFAGAIFAPEGHCQVWNDQSTVSDGYRTIWLGAATCKSMAVRGSSRLRYDGGLIGVKSTSTATTGSAVWALIDYHSVD